MLRLLTDDHERLLPVLTRLKLAAEQNETRELDHVLNVNRVELHDELDKHIGLEEDSVFPRLAGYLSRDLLAPFYDDHREIQATRDRLYASGQDSRRVLVFALTDLLRSHIEREENMLFPAARNALPHAQLEF